ncbi:DUF3617 family protein [Methylobacterium planeticum]|uniref:DUF3617 family protein n=2 Tax=Methylobacterium planeticum TaxID=2615211 RepID=A0A6N6MKM4_9HYPH|nr:DUF3617 family protein [Methylobacterium planeticum]
MDRIATRIGLTLALGLSASAAPAAEAMPGAYTVETRVELPHLEDLNSRSLASLCITADAERAHGLGSLSANTPLAGCPLANVDRAGEVLTFDIVCAGKNQARGSARFVMAAERFEGRITMRLGGKNMTMTEVQSGRRTGPCP